MGSVKIPPLHCILVEKLYAFLMCVRKGMREGGKKCEERCYFVCISCAEIKKSLVFPRTCGGQ
jgi:hypothetical protein